MENNLENIKAKIRKLLTLSKSDNENEAYISLAKANELINKYKLNKDSLRFETSYAKTTKLYTPYRSIIANAVSWLYCCHSYRNTLDKTYVFVGEYLYSYLAGEMFTYLVNAINRCARKSIRKHTGRRFFISFKYGMADRIYDRIMELGKACSWAPYREEKIKEITQYIEKTTSLKKIERNKIKLNPIAIKKGISYGNNVSLARQARDTQVLQIQ